MIKRLLTLVLALALPAQALSSQALAANPAIDPNDPAVAVVETLDQGLQEAMNGPVGGTFEERMALLEPIMEAAFDYPFMAQVAAGKYWAGFKPEEQAHYSELFAKVSVAAAASRFKSKPGAAFAITGLREANGGRRYIETTLTVPGRDPLKIAYLVQQGADGAWKAVDLFYNGTVSELATKRSEYTSVLKSDGLAVLLSKLAAKVAQYASE